MEGSSSSSSSSSIKTMEVPSVAVRWIVSNSTSTNVELAALSNVSQAWRDIVVECLVDNGVDDDSKSPPDHLARLLVPSWIRHLCANNDASSRQSPKLHDDNRDDDTYCVAWFHPGGIRSKLLATSRPEAEARVLLQWDGYREAMDVLGPFGYSNSLLRTILEKTRSRFLDNGSDSKAASTDSSSDSCTPAVRGALYARPEGYSTSWDKYDGDQIVDQLKSEILTIQRPMRKEELERLVLPRILSRNHNDQKKSTSDRPPPFVQFLNMDSRHAIRLLTPKFQNPVFTPITVFCVAIATEDGCFFSGLGQEFAMGHMYPTSHNENICDDRSPICLSANYTERKIDLSTETPEDAAISNLPDHMRETYLGPGCDFLNSMITEESDSDSDSSDDDSGEGAAHAVSGQLGPGAWHCYTAVFDGNQSTIRIDGEEESTTLASTIPESSRACLDGITIGSDHSFDMSLCFGQGSDGEGEGAIAELAFFKGKLPLEDICTLESHLMAKHGILAPLTSRDERMQEDYLSRLAHKLMDQSAARAARNRDPGVSVPLRCMTGLRHVAWKQRDKVTGHRRSIIRIGGKKLSTGSTTSDS